MNEFFEFFESDQEWMTLEDYCLERDLLLDQTQLIREGHAITRYLRTHCLPGPHKLPHDRYGPSMATDDVVSIAGMKNSWHASKLCTPRRGPWRQPQTAHDGERIKNRGRGQDG